MKPLNAKQQAFVTEYLTGVSAAQAAVRAGYSTRAAKQQAHRLLSMAAVAARLTELQRQAADAAVMSHREALETLTRIARARLADFLDRRGRISLARIRGATQELAELVEETMPDGRVRRKIKLRDPVQAIERLSRLMGWDKPLRVEGRLDLAVDHRITMNDIRVYGEGSAQTPGEWKKAGGDVQPVPPSAG